MGDLDKDTGRDPFAFQGLNPGGPEGAFGYTIPNLLIDHAMRNPHVPPGFWRGVNLNQNAIYLECFVDELARRTGTELLTAELARELRGRGHEAAVFTWSRGELAMRLEEAGVPVTLPWMARVGTVAPPATVSDARNAAAGSSTISTGLSP